MHGNEVNQTPPRTPPTTIVPHSQGTVSVLTLASFEPRQEQHEQIYVNEKEEFHEEDKVDMAPASATKAPASAGKDQKTRRKKAAPSTPGVFCTTKYKPPIEKSADVRLQYAQEKQMVKFRIPPDSGKNAVFQNLSNSLWGTVLHVDWEFMDVKRREADFQIHKYPGIQLMMTVFDSDLAKLMSEDAVGQNCPNTFRSISRRVVICPSCYNHVDIPLNKAIIQCGKDGGNSFNISQHRERTHSPTEEFPNLMKTVEVSSSNTVASPSMQSSISRFAHNLPSRFDAKKIVRDAIFCCVNDLGFPASTVERPEFREMLRQIHLNAPVINPRDFMMSNQAIAFTRVEEYNNAIRVVSNHATKIRSEYKSICGRSIPYVTICHDIWQGHKKDVLGVTLTYCDPRNCEIYRVPIGLVNTHGHTAREVSDHTIKLMRAFGLSQSDLSASVNDNTGAAVLAGKYIVDTKATGQCSMHKAELILKHATGLCTRSVRGVVVDSNESFVKVYSKFFKFASWLMSKRSPSRFKRYRNWNIKHGRVVNDIPMPNDTRVAGCPIMFQGFLRDIWSLKEYAEKGDGDAEWRTKFPTNEEWECLSQFEAVLGPLQSFSMLLQRDDPSANSAALIEAFFSRQEIMNMRTSGVDCVPTKKENYSLHEFWDGSATMDAIDSKRKVIVFEELHNATKTLINRLIKEYAAYFLKEKDTDAEKAILANPMLCFYAPEVLEHYKVYDLTSDMPRLVGHFVDDMVDKFSNKHHALGAAFAKQRAAAASAIQQPTDAIPQPTEAKIPQPTEAAAAPEGAQVPAAPAQEPPQPQPATVAAKAQGLQGIHARRGKRTGSFFSSYRQAKEQNAESLANITGTAAAAESEAKLRATLRRECHKELQTYLANCETEFKHKDWRDIISEYPTKTYADDSAKWTDDERAQFDGWCDEKDFLQLGKHFDVLGWWNENKQKYPKVFVTAIIWLTKPATNAAQERVFSKASWFDQNRLMRSQSPKTFEMRILGALNRPVIKRILENEAVLENAAKEKIRQRNLKLGRMEVLDLTSDDADIGVEMEEDGGIGIDLSPRAQVVQLINLTSDLHDFNKKNTWCFPYSCSAILVSYSGSTRAYRSGLGDGRFCGCCQHHG